jgi:heme exporter protein A
LSLATGSGPERLQGTPAVAVRAEGLTHRYGRRATGVEALVFAFDGPGTVAVTGANGSGKSTLLRILAGLLRPTSGSTSIRRDGRELGPRERRAAVGLASPEIQFYEEFSGFENLCFVGECRRLSDPAEAARAALDEVGLGARGRDRVGAYSSGMKQRLRLAFALLHRPALLLLDEPSGHLDDEGHATVGAIVRARSEHGLVVVATNDLREVRLAERRIELHGRGLGRPA